MSFTYHITEEEMEQIIDRYFQEVHGLEVVWSYDPKFPVTDKGGLNLEVFSEVSVQRNGLTEATYDTSIWDEQDFSEGDYEAIQAILNSLGGSNG